MIKTSCSCGFTVETETAEEGYAITHKHFIDEINTHVIKTVQTGMHLHVDRKPWYRKIFRGIKKWLRNP